MKFYQGEQVRSVLLRPELERSMFGFLSRKPACPPIIKMWEIGNQESMLAVVKWMIKNETDFGSILCNPVASYLYNKHLRPRVGELTNPETAFGRIPHFPTWVILKSLLLHDKHLKDGSAAKWNETIEIFTGSYQEAKLVQHLFCKFVTCWFCEAVPAVAMRARSARRKQWGQVLEENNGVRSCKTTFPV